MNKVVCRCNREFETFVELLEHFESEHTVEARARRISYLKNKSRRIKYPRLAKSMSLGKIEPMSISKDIDWMDGPRQERIPNDL